MNCFLSTKNIPIHSNNEKRCWFYLRLPDVQNADFFRGFNIFISITKRYNKVTIVHIKISNIGAYSNNQKLFFHWKFDINYKKTLKTSIYHSRKGSLLFFLFLLFCFIFSLLMFSDVVVMVNLSLYLYSSAFRYSHILQHFLYEKKIYRLVFIVGYWWA